MATKSTLSNAVDGMGVVGRAQSYISIVVAHIVAVALVQATVGDRVLFTVLRACGACSVSVE